MTLSARTGSWSSFVFPGHSRKVLVMATDDIFGTHRMPVSRTDPSAVEPATVAEAQLD